jgi:four helix bundle protein
MMELAIDVISFTSKFPKEVVYQVIERQLIRSVTSVGANYHAACRAKSRPDFINKLHIVEEECDESIYWMKLTGRLQKQENDLFKDILNELNQIMGIIVTSLKTMKGIK